MRMQWVSKVNSYTWGLVAAVLCLAYGAIASNFLACVLALALVMIFGKQAWEARQTRPKAATTTDDSSSPAQKPKRKRRKKKRKNQCTRRAHLPLSLEDGKDYPS